MGPRAPAAEAGPEQLAWQTAGLDYSSFARLPLARAMSEVEEELKARIEEITKASELQLKQLNEAEQKLNKAEQKLSEAEQTFQATEAKLKQEAADAAAKAEEKFSSLLTIQQGAYTAPSALTVDDLRLDCLTLPCLRRST